MPHLVVDGFGGDISKMGDLEFIYRLLDDYPGRIDMHKVMPPYVFRYTDSDPRNWGVSGFVLIAESHISIHAFPERNYVNCDIFSCGAFNPESATQYLREALNLTDINTVWLEDRLDGSFNPDTFHVETGQLRRGIERDL